MSERERVSERECVLDVLCNGIFRRRQKIHEHFRCVNEHIGGAVLDRPVPPGTLERGGRWRCASVSSHHNDR